MLGEDRVTGFKGVIDTIGLDLYGCVQCTIKPVGLDEKGETFKGQWFDVSRVRVGDRRVMDVPAHFYQAEAQTKRATSQGAADKPSAETRSTPR
jgi:hypothetical protein